MTIHSSPVWSVFFSFPVCLFMAVISAFSGSSTTLIMVLPIIGSLTSFIPRRQKTRTFASRPALMEYEPSVPVMTLFFVPSIIT